MSARVRVRPVASGVFFAATLPILAGILWMLAAPAPAGDGLPVPGRGPSPEPRQEPPPPSPGGPVSVAPDGRPSARLRGLPCASCPATDFGPFLPGAVGETHSSSIAAGCWRTYAFHVLEGQTYRFSVCPQDGGSWSGDYWGFVIDIFGEGCELLAWAQPHCFTPQTPDFTAPYSGTIYVRIREAKYGEGWYTLSWRLLPAPCGNLSCPAHDYGPFTPTPAGGTHSASLLSRCAKLYRFDLSGGRRYRFSLCEDGAGSEFAGVLDLQVPGGGGCSSSTWDEGGCGGKPVIDVTAADTGPVFLRLQDFGGGGGAYTLAYREVLPGECSYNRVCWYPDYGPLTPSTAWQTLAGTECRVIGFRVTAGRRYRFSFCEGGGAAAFDTVLEQWNGAVWPCALESWNDDSCGTGSRLDYVAPSTGTAYIRVRGKNPTAEPWTLAYSEIGTGEPCNQGSCNLPDFEMSDLPASGYGTHSARMPPGCTRVYRFVAREGETYRFTFCEGGGSAEFDTQLDLWTGVWDPYGTSTPCTWRAWNGDACGTPSRLDYTLPPGTGYGHVFIRVKDVGGTGGNYTLAFTRLP